MDKDALQALIGDVRWCKHLEDEIAEALAAKGPAITPDIEEYFREAAESLKAERYTRIRDIRGCFK